MKYRSNRVLRLWIALAVAVNTANAMAVEPASYVSADLPDAMTFLDGRKVETLADWQDRKKEIQRLWCDYFIGHYPKEVPSLLSARKALMRPMNTLT